MLGNLLKYLCWKFHLYIDQAPAIEVNLLKLKCRPENCLVIPIFQDFVIFTYCLRTELQTSEIFQDFIIFKGLYWEIKMLKIFQNPLENSNSSWLIFPASRSLFKRNCFSAIDISERSHLALLQRRATSDIPCRQTFAAPDARFMETK